MQEQIESPTLYPFFLECQIGFNLHERYIFRWHTSSGKIPKSTWKRFINDQPDYFEYIEKNKKYFKE